MDLEEKIENEKMRGKGIRYEDFNDKKIFYALEL